MPKRKTQFVNGKFYHLMKRGVEERKVFLDDEDRFRFINSLLVFNDQKPTPWASRAFWYQQDPKFLTARNYKLENPLVEIHAFVLMPNHFHLLVRQLAENGIVVLMNKLGGYSYYFNKKYERVGPLFQGRFKAIMVETEKQLKNNFVYINTNPVGIIESGWKELEVKNSQRAIQFLEEEYQWSSCWDYLGKQNFSSVITREFFLKLFGGEKEIKEEIESWILFKADSGRLKEIIFE